MIIMVIVVMIVMVIVMVIIMVIIVMSMMISSMSGSFSAALQQATAKTAQHMGAIIFSHTSSALISTISSSSIHFNHYPFFTAITSILVIIFLFWELDFLCHLVCHLIKILCRFLLYLILIFVFINYFEQSFLNLF